MEATHSQEPTRESKAALLVGVFTLLLGLVLVMTRWIVYYGEWPDERPVYLAGIGYFLVSFGAISMMAGAFFHFRAGQGKGTETASTPAEQDKPSA